MNNFVYTMLKNAKRQRDLKTIESLYNGNVNDSILKFEYAKMLIYYGHYQKAKSLLLELLNTRNADYAMLELGIAERQIGNIESSRSYFKTLAEKNDKAAIFKLAKLEFDQNNIELAKTLYSSLLKSKNSGMAKIELGKIAESEGNIEQAKGYFQSAINNDKLVSARLALGKLERNIGNIDEARRIFLYTYDNCHSLSGKYELGRLEKALGNIDAARKIFKELLNNNSVQANIELGKLEFDAGNIEEAKNHFLALKDTIIERFGYYFLIILCVKTKDYNSAFNYMKEAISRGNALSSDIIVFLSQNLNVYFDIDYEYVPNLYSINQLIDYDPYIALDHVICRHVDLKARDFENKIDIYKVFNTIKSELKDEYRTHRLAFNDIYMIPYKNVGINGENTLKVITLPNSKDIITMYPVFTMFDHMEEESMRLPAEEFDNLTITKKLI